MNGNTDLKAEIDFKTEDTVQGHSEDNCPDTPNVEQVYNDFWKPIIEKDGTLDVDQMKKELYDFYVMIGEVPKVYCHITGNKLSKPLYPAETVIRAADDYTDQLIEEAIKEFKEENVRRALVEVIDAIESGSVVNDHRGKVYRQEFGNAFLKHLKEAVKNAN